MRGVAPGPPRFPGALQVVPRASEAQQQLFPVPGGLRVTEWPPGHGAGGGGKGGARKAGTAIPSAGRASCYHAHLHTGVGDFVVGGGGDAARGPPEADRRAVANCVCPGSSFPETPDLPTNTRARSAGF